MTCELPPDSRAITHAWNEPDVPEYVLVVTAGACVVTYEWLTGAEAACCTGAATGLGAGGPSSAGGLGIRAGLTGTRSTCPAAMMFAHRTLLWLAQYSTGHASGFW